MQSNLRQMLTIWTICRSSQRWAIALLVAIISISLINVSPAVTQETESSWQRVFGSLTRWFGGTRDDVADNERDDIADNERDDVADDPPGTSRDGLCLASPISPTATSLSSNDGGSTQGTTQVWNPQPTFVWQGRVEEIALRIAGEDEPFWEQSVLGAWYALYDGEPLAEGQTYEWLAYPVSPTEQMQIATFQVVSAENSDRIGAGLAEIDGSLGNLVLGSETAAVIRANYFADLRLWADMWQTVVAVEHPSEELEELREAAVAQSCSSR